MDKTGGETVYGIYNADGSIIGELRYVFMKLSGRGSCSLCDITHTWAWKKQSFDIACKRSGFNFKLLHTNEATKEQLEAAKDLPAILIYENGQYRRVMGPQELAECHKDPDVLMSRLSLLI